MYIRTTAGTEFFAHDTVLVCGELRLLSDVRTVLQGLWTGASKDVVKSKKKVKKYKKVLDI